jgi:tyrosine decarboxylase/aspartate 1-decarboxylase
VRDGACPLRPLARARGSVVTGRLRRAHAEDWDFREGRIFGSLCTQPHPASAPWILPFLTANLGNPGLCPGTARLSEELLQELLGLYHAPRTGAGGWWVSGATEANVTALWVFRNLTGGSEVVLPVSAHFSLVKALDLLRLRPRWVPVDAAGRMDVRKARDRLGRRTAAVVALAGSTELGAVDPIAEVSDMALGAGVPLHVDAALGGFLLPFLPANARQRFPFDFRLPGVRSLAVDPHKLGQAPIPSGVLLFRRLAETASVEVDSPYLSDPRARGLLGTRPSASIAATYAVVHTLGSGGYRREARRLLSLTRWLAREGRRLGLEPVTEPVLNVVAFRHPNPVGVQSWMLQRGWDVSAIERPRALRFVLMPHVRESLLPRLRDDLASALRRFPPRAGASTPRGPGEGKGPGRRTGTGWSDPRSSAG